MPLNLRETIDAGLLRGTVAKADARLSVQLSGGVVAYRLRNEIPLAAVLAELNARRRAMPMAVLLALAGGVAGFAAFGTMTAVVTVVVAGAIVGLWIDAYRRSCSVFYDLDDEARAAYTALAAAFDRLADCDRVWRIEAAGPVDHPHLRKRHAGADQLLARRDSLLTYALPRVLKSNVMPPAIVTGKDALYFLPDVILVVGPAGIGAVAYDALRVQWHESRFVEEGTVPADAEILSRAWKHPRKDGGPDRRFSDNRELPLCRYEIIRLTSGNGLDEVLQLSRGGLAGQFWDAVQSMAWVAGTGSRARDLPHLPGRI